MPCCHCLGLAWRHQWTPPRLHYHTSKAAQVLGSPPSLTVRTLSSQEYPKLIPVATGKQTPRVALALTTPSITAPGSDIILSVGVKGCTTSVQAKFGLGACGPLAEDARVFVVVVDKAWLDLEAARPSYNTELSRATDVLVTTLSAGSSLDYLLSSEAIGLWSLVWLIPLFYEGQAPYIQGRVYLQCIL
jgi:hypothetical protein